QALTTYSDSIGYSGGRGQRRTKETGVASGAAVALREWSIAGRGVEPAPTAARSSSPWPLTHSGSGPSRGRPVKNLAAMQPPWQASNDPHEAQAPADDGSRSSRKR